MKSLFDILVQRSNFYKAAGYSSNRLDRRGIPPSILESALSIGLIYESEGSFWILSSKTRFQHRVIWRKGILIRLPEHILEEEPSFRWWKVPDDTLKEFIKALLGGQSRGRWYIARHPLWYGLGIIPEGELGHTSEDLESMLDVLCDQKALICLFGGSDWSISERRDPD